MIDQIIRNILYNKNVHMQKMEMKLRKYIECKKNHKSIKMYDFTYILLE